MEPYKKSSVGCFIGHGRVYRIEYCVHCQHLSHALGLRGGEGDLSCNKGSGRVYSYADTVVLNEVGGAMANEIIVKETISINMK